MAENKQNTELPQVGRCFGGQSHSSDEDMPVDSGEGNFQLLTVLEEGEVPEEREEERAFARSLLTGRSPPTLGSAQHHLTVDRLDSGAVQCQAGAPLDPSSASQVSDRALAPESVVGGTGATNESSLKAPSRKNTIPPAERRRMAKEEKWKAAGEKWLPFNEWRKLQSKRKRASYGSPHTDAGNDCEGVSPMRRQEPKRQKRCDTTPPSAANPTSGELSYREQLASRKLAIVPAAYPEDKLTDMECRRIQVKLGDLIIDDESGIGPLQVAKTYQEKGAVVAVCCNDATCNWLKGKAADLSVREGLEMLVGDYKDLLRSVKVLLKVEKPFPEADHMEPKRVLVGLEKQNPGINSKDWRVVNRRQEMDFQTLVLVIDEGSALVLENMGWRAFVGASRVTFRALTSVHPLPAPETVSHGPVVRGDKISGLGSSRGQVIRRYFYLAGTGAVCLV